MSEKEAPPRVETEPDPQMDQVLAELATALPSDAVLADFDKRLEARLDAEAVQQAAASKAGFVVGAGGILIPQARKSKAPLFIGIAGVLAAGLAAAVVYLYLRPPETRIVTTTVEETEWVTVEKEVPVTAEADVVAMAGDHRSDDEEEFETGEEEIGSPESASADEDGEYDPEDETAAAIAAARAKLKAGAGKKRRPGKPGKPRPEELDDDDILATSAPKKAVGSKVTDKPVDPSKAGVFEKDLEELLARKKKAATATPKAATAAAKTTKALRKDEVRKVIGTAMRKIGSCGLIDTGTVTVEWFVPGTGIPSKIKAKGKHSKSALGACVTNIIKGLKFPKHDGDSQKITYPFKVTAD